MSEGNGTNGTPDNANECAVILHPDPEKARVLAAFAELGTVVAACRHTGVARRSWYNWVRSDHAFAQAVLDLENNVVDELEHEAVSRAKDGSDRLLMFILQARLPQRYRAKNVITEVSPEVKSCLARQIETIDRFFQSEFGAEQGRTMALRLVTELGQVWSS